MNPEYKEIFDQRGGSYHAAMTSFPQARRAEFEALFSKTPCRSGDVIVDLPAGGAYLLDYLPPDIRYFPREITPGFSVDATLVEWDGDWNAPPADHVVTCAAAHHFDDHANVIDRALGALRSGGVLHLADVDVASPVGGFLDGFVGAHTPTGHDGNFLPAKGDAFYRNYKIARHETVRVPWTFRSLDDAGQFCIGLFGLQIDDGAMVIDALREHGIDVVETSQSAIIDWRLTYIDIINA